jgi:hypothetical protein
MKKPLFLTLILVTVLTSSSTVFGQVYSGLIGKYSFNNGTAKDEAGTNDGSVFGASLTTDRFGNAGKAYYFNGTSNYILLPQNAVPNLNMIDAITVSAWIKPDDINSGLRTIVGKWNGSTQADQFLFTQDGNDNFMAIRSVNSGGVNDNSNSLIAGNWHHVVFIYDKFDNNRHKIFVDGVQVYNNTFGGMFTSTVVNTFACIGAQYGDANGTGANIQRYFKGAIDDIQIYNRSLTNAEVQQLFNAPAPYNPDDNGGLISKYSFNFGNTVDEVNTNNAIQSNTTLTTDRFGNSNLARNFNGSTSNMFVYHNPSINLDNLDAFTLSTWIKPTTTTSGLRTIIGKWNNDPSSEQFLLAQSGIHLLIAVKGINSSGTTALADLEPNTWYHIVYTYSKADNNRQKVYVNNVEVFNSTFGGSYTNTTANTHMSFGAQYGDLNDGPPSLQRFFNGAIDDIHIYNRVITLAQVDSLYTIPNPITPCVPTSSSITVSTCAPYVAPDGQSYSTSGNISAIIQNAEGCDSTIAIALTILPTTFSTISPVVCANYVAPDGQSYTTSGTYQAIIPNHVGCDSTITIHLLVNNTTNTLNISTCGSYLAPDGQNYTTSGNYTATIPNEAGCDSIITINLMVNMPTSSLITVSACDAYVAPDGQTYTSSGSYTAIITNQAGCDSTITINLQINNATSSTLNIVSCDAYLAPNGNTYGSSGTYSMTIPNQAGCDSLITLNLTVDLIDNNVFVLNSETLSVLEVAGHTYQWIDCNDGNTPVSGATNPQFTPTVTGNYAAIISSANCSSTTLCTAITVGTSTGILSNRIEKSLVYPNPTNDLLYLQTSSAVLATLYSIEGKRLDTYPVNGLISISVGHLPSGIYFIHFQNEAGELYQTKFIKE